MDSKKINRNTCILLILILLLALGLRSGVFYTQMNMMNIMNDPKNYWIMSHQLVDEGIYGYAYDAPSGEPNARVTPGYPLFLAAVYKIVGDKYLQITAVRLLQVIASSLSVLLGFMIVKKAFKNDLTALLTALLMAVYPTYAFSPALLLTETLAFFTMLLYFWLSLYAFETGKKIINLITGMVFALHVLIRPALLPLFIFPFIFALISGKKQNEKRSFKSLAIMFVFQLIGLVIVMAPWWIRNIVTLGTFILTAKASGNPFLAGTYPYFQDYFLDVTPEIRSTNDSQMAYGIQRLLNGLKNDFWLYIKWFTIGKIKFMFEQPYLSRLLSNTQIPSMIIHFSVLIPGVIGSIMHAFKSMKSFWFYFYGLTMLGIQLMFVPDPRFVYFVMFFIITGAAHLISSIIGLIKKPKKNSPQVGVTG